MRSPLFRTASKRVFAQINHIFCNLFGSSGYNLSYCNYHCTEYYPGLTGFIIIIVILTNKSLPTPNIIRNLGIRFREYRMRLRMTRKEVSETAGVGMTTLYKFESGNMTDISFRTIVRLLRAIGLHDNWENLFPELPESPYMYYDNNKKMQRVRHSSKK